MRLGLHVARSSWDGGPRAIRARLAELADAAEAAGCEHISAMDHYFQIEGMFAVEEAMLETGTACDE